MQQCLGDLKDIVSKLFTSEIKFLYGSSFPHASRTIYQNCKQHNQQTPSINEIFFAETKIYFLEWTKYLSPWLCDEPWKVVDESLMAVPDNSPPF